MLRNMKWATVKEADAHLSIDAIDPGDLRAVAHELVTMLRESQRPDLSALKPSDCNSSVAHIATTIAIIIVAASVTPCVHCSTIPPVCQLYLCNVTLRAHFDHNVGTPSILTPVIVLHRDPVAPEDYY